MHKTKMTQYLKGYFTFIKKISYAIPKYLLHKTRLDIFKKYA